MMKVNDFIKVLEQNKNKELLFSYEQDKFVLTDGDFDLLCKRMLENWDDIKHPHKYKIRKKDLEAGTGYAMVYTNMIKGSAESWYQEWERECGK